MDYVGRNIQRRVVACSDMIEQNREAAVFKFLAQVFRGFHYIIGISEPPPGTSDRAFVFAWLVGFAFITALFILLVFYVIPFLYFRH